jgi:hypothetical protein
LTVHRGWTYEQIGELTMAQVRNEFLQGKSPREAAATTASVEEVDEFLAECRAECRAGRA